VKNRFGPTNEIGVFEMKEEGLCEVKDPSHRFYDPESNESGNSFTAVIEGTTSLVAEVQALAVKPQFSVPRRLSKGVEPERLAMVLAVLSKKLQIPLESNDIFLNLLGGLKIKDPGIELALAASIFSSFSDLTVTPMTAFFGEIGLDGKIRNVSFPEKRLTELIRLGFKKAVIPAGNLKNIKDNSFSGLEITGYKYLKDALINLFRR